MPSPFDAIDAATQAAMDGVFGEGITVRPMAGGDQNYGRAPDPDRPVRENVRVIISHAPKAGGADFASSERNGALVAQQPSELWFGALAYAALGYPLKRGDVIELEDGAKFTVAPMPPTDQGDVQLIITGGA